MIFRGAIEHWPAFKRWENNDYFRSKIGSKIVTVSVTPNGYADAALPIIGGITNDENTNHQFVMPHEEEITVNQFLNLLEACPNKRMLVSTRFDNFAT